MTYHTGNHTGNSSDMFLLLILLFWIGLYEEFNVLVNLFLQLPHLFELEALPVPLRLEQIVRESEQWAEKLSLLEAQEILGTLHRDGALRGTRGLLLPQLAEYLDKLVVSLNSDHLHACFWGRPRYDMDSFLDLSPWPLGNALIVQELFGSENACQLPGQPIGCLGLCQFNKLLGPSHPACAIAYSNTGQFLVTALGNTLRVWDVTGLLLFVLQGHVYIRAVQIIPGPKVLSVDDANFAACWDLADGSLEAKVNLAQSGIENVFFVPSASTAHFTLLSLGEDGNFYQLNRFVSLPFLPKILSSSRLFNNKATRVACCNPEGTLVAYGGESTSIYVATPSEPGTGWTNLDLEEVLVGHLSEVIALSFSSSGNRLLSCSTDNTFRVWSRDTLSGDWSSLAIGRQTDSSPGEMLCRATWSSCNNVIVAAYTSGMIRIFCSHSGRLIQSLAFSSASIDVLETHFTHPNHVLVTCQQGSVSIVDVRDGRQFRVLEANGDYQFVKACWSPDGKSFTLASRCGACLVYNPSAAPGLIRKTAQDKPCRFRDHNSCKPATKASPLTRPSDPKPDHNDYFADVVPERSPAPNTFGSLHSPDDLVQEAPRSENEWATQTEVYPGKYFPQIGDPIVYLLSGHREYVEGSDALSVKVHLADIEISHKINLIESGVVEDISVYVDGRVSLANIILCLESGLTVTVAVVTSDLPRFIVHQDTYNAGCQGSLEVGAQVKVHGQGDFRTVLSVSSGTDPWNKVCLSGYQRPFGAWKLVYTPLSSLDTKTSEFYSGIVESLIKDPRFLPFVELVGMEADLSYLEHVAVPTSLSQIQLRLKGGFYRSKTAFVYDLELIYLNAREYYIPSSEIVCLSRALVTRAKDLLREAEASKAPIRLPEKRRRPSPSSSQGDPDYIPGDSSDSDDPPAKKKPRRGTSQSSNGAVVSHYLLRPRRKISYAELSTDDDSPSPPPPRRKSQRRK